MRDDVPPPPPPPAGTLPLTPRAPEEVLFRRGAEPLTVARFLADVAALAAHLPEGEGRHALNLCTDRYLALVAFAAALSRGQVSLLSADRSPRRLRELLETHAGAYAIADGGDWPLLPAPLRCDDLLSVRRPPEAPDPAPRIPAARIAAIAFTSGSTGTPTPHAKSWGALVACAEAASERFGLRAEDGPPATLVATVPPQHMYGFETSIILPLHSAAAAHAGAVFYPSDIAEALAAVPPRRVLVTTPLQLRAQLASGAPAPAALEAVISATAPLDPDLAARAEREWGTRVLEIYGATEAGSLASRRTLDGAAWQPYRGVRLSVAEGAAVAEVPGLPHAVPLADEIEADSDGRFRLIGRRADVVKLAGKRASLAGLNRILTAIEGVEDGVFVAPEDLDSNPRARLTAYVVAPNRSAAEIVAALRERVEAAFLPRPVVMLDALPRDAVGKLTRRALDLLRPPRDGA